MHAVSEVRGRLYKGAGESWGPSRLTHLTGGLTGGVLRLERRTEGTLPLASMEERLRVYGLKGARGDGGAGAPLHGWGAGSCAWTRTGNGWK